MENITLLDIYAEKGKEFRNRHNPIFKGLTKLKTLGIHGKALNALYSGTFEGLPSLDTLDLSYSVSLGFYYRHSELIVKYNIGLKTLLQQGISEPIFYGDLVYKFKRTVGKPNFSDQFKKIVKRYIRVGYNLDIMRQSACLVLNPIMVYSYGFLFNCTTVGQASDSMTALT